MSKRQIFAVLLGLTALLPAPARAADEKAAQSDKPGVILRFASLDHLLGDFRYLAEVVGEWEKAKQFDELIKSKLGEKGLEGIDTKKAIGLYSWIGSTGFDSKVVFLVPIADKKAFLDLVSDTLDVKPQKGDGDLYSMDVDKVPYTVYLRFANDYVYITVRDKEVLDKDKLLAPAVVLPAGQVGSVSVLVNIDQIPENLRELALGTIENRIADLKDKEMPGHTKAQKNLRDAAVDELSAQIKSLLNHGGETTLRLDLDRKAGELALTASVAGKSGSPLAETIGHLGEVKSATASLLHKDAAMRSELNVNLPEKLRALLGPALKDAEKQALDKAKNDQERELLKTLLDGIMPTLRAAELDTAFDLQGPSDKGLYTMVGGIKIKDPAELEKRFRKTAGQFPKQVNLDAEKANGVAIHRINPDKNLKPSARRTLGENPLYVAFHGDVLLLGAGDKGLSAIQEALAAEPTTGKVWELQVALPRVAPMFEDPVQAEIARKGVFGDNKDGGRVRLTLEGGKALTLRLVLDAKVLDYLNRVEKAKKK